MLNSKTEQLLGIYETHLPVSDLKRSVAYYRDQIGLELATEIPERDITFFWVGGKNTGMLGLWGSGSGPLHMKLHFAFRATLVGVLTACENLRAADIQPLGFHGEPVDEPDVNGWMPSASIYFKDPDGHSIEFLSVLKQEPDNNLGVASYTTWIEKHGVPNV